MKIRTVVTAVALVLTVAVGAALTFLGCAQPQATPYVHLYMAPASPAPGYAPIPGVQDLYVEHNTEAYDHVDENPFLAARTNPLSTFAIDVDTASYANIRRFLTSNQLPPRDAIRIEEMVNYFRYSYPSPDGQHPFSVTVDVAGCPWTPAHRLARVALHGKDVDRKDRPPANLVFLLDVSGSMQPENKLPLVQRAMNLLLDELTEQDRVAIVVYASGTGVALESTSCERKDVIRAAIGRLQAGGSTNGEGGIQLAYKQAQQSFIRGGVNRVILCTDGDFNVGITDQGSLVSTIEEKAKGGVFLSVLGFGMGNLKDSTLEKLAKHGHGNHAYIDTISEAKKVLVEEMAGTLITIAKDVKIQVEFNPAKVSAYRLIGYEHRLLRKEDFNNDAKDGGDIGAGHTVTALYEVVPGGVGMDLPSVDALKYQADPHAAPTASEEIMTVKLRYKQPHGQTSSLISVPVPDKPAKFDAVSDDFKFAASVASFGMILRDSKHKGQYTLDAVMELARQTAGNDPYRKEFTQLVQKAIDLRKGDRHE
ncbi:MAG: von Willebrand factor type A domain-containing protein [Phycisphaerae bacterium]